MISTKMGFLWMVFLVLAVVTVSVTAQPHATNDSTRLQASNGEIVFALNSSGEYSLENYLNNFTDPSGAWLLDPYIAIATGFVDTITKGVPWPGEFSSMTSCHAS
jgi:hypothetical protein